VPHEILGKLKEIGNPRRRRLARSADPEHGVEHDIMFDLDDLFNNNAPADGRC
jgi:hypothetical protein